MKIFDLSHNLIPKNSIKALKNADIKEVTLLGYAMWLRTNCHNTNYFFCLKNRQDCIFQAQELGIFDFFYDLVNSIAPTLSDCGEYEQDFEDALASEHWQVRKLVAINALNINALDCDNNYIISLIDKLVNDDSAQVRAQVARVGLDRHLDILVNDSCEQVLMKVARFGNTEHLSLLLNKSITLKVKKVISENPSLTNEQANLFINDLDTNSRISLSKRGLGRQALMDDNDKELQQTLKDIDMEQYA